MDLTCPKCQAPMRTYERSGVTVDQCTECRGIFLDRGELERLVDAETSFHAVDRGRPAAPQPTYQQQPYSYGSKAHKRRKSFLEELFD